MTKESERENKGKHFFVRVSDSIGISDSVDVEVKKAYKAAMGTLSLSGHYYQVATDVVNRVERAGTINPADLDILKVTLTDWQKYDNRMQTELEEQRAQKNPEGLRNIDAELKDYMHNVLKKQELSNATWANILNHFSVKSSKAYETNEFSKKSHEELLSIFKEWVGTIDKNLISSITHGLDEEGIDIIVETVLPKFKFGIQIKSNGDLLESNFIRDVKAQITESKQYDLRGFIIILCGDLTKNKVRSRSRSLTALVSRFTDDYVKIVPPEQAISMVKMCQ
jgi:hypothetical protein